MAVYGAALPWDDLIAALTKLRPTDSNLKAVVAARKFNALGSGPAGVVVEGNLLRNGSFEEGPDPVRWFTYAVGSTAIPAWTVTRGSVDLLGPVWKAAHGRRAIDMDGNQPGTIQQAFPTVVGRHYRVTFNLAAQTWGASPLVKRLRVLAAGKWADFVFDGSGHDPDNPGWVGKSWDFTATGTSTTLIFMSLSASGSDGPLLDNVAVVPVGDGTAK